MLSNVLRDFRSLETSRRTHWTTASQAWSVKLKIKSSGLSYTGLRRTFGQFFKLTQVSSGVLPEKGGKPWNITAIDQYPLSAASSCVGEDSRRGTRRGCIPMTSSRPKMYKSCLEGPREACYSGVEYQLGLPCGNHSQYHPLIGRSDNRVRISRLSHPHALVHGPPLQSTPNDQVLILDLIELPIPIASRVSGAFHVYSWLELADRPCSSWTRSWPG